MRKILFGFLTGAIILSCANIANAYEPIYDKYQVVYNPTTKTFSTGGMAPSRIVLTKKTSTGTGSYSEYYAPNGNLVLTTGGNFEFIDKNHLISVHNAELKYFRIVFQDGEYKEVELSENELQKYFPDAEIVKISSFENNKITLTKPYFKKKTFLLYNDTKADFYKYSYNNRKLNKSDIRGLFTAKYPQKIRFSHFGENTEKSPMLVITVRNN